MANIYSVSKVNSYIKNMMNQDYMLRNIQVRGEISNCKHHSTGIYFTLKDEKSSIAAVIFGAYRNKMQFKLENGQKIVAVGKVDVFERDGRYQLYVTDAIQDGVGDLHQQYENLKQELEEMGMFSKQYKKPIPSHAMKIGIVTAKTGAAIQDIMNITKRRNPYVQLYLYSALVQGDGAAPSISQGIQCLDKMNLDLLIVGRGGGSIEDLWAFNTEVVARTIFECETPIILAVGHEIDFTISDFVADCRAETPSAAAEIAVFDYKEYIDKLLSIQYTLHDKLTYKLQYQKIRLDNYKTKIMHLSPENQVFERRKNLNEISFTLSNRMENILKQSKHKLEVLCTKLEGMSPLTKLGGGYVYAKNNDKVVNSVVDIQTGDLINISMTDGHAVAEILEVKRNKDGN